MEFLFSESSDGFGKVAEGNSADMLVQVDAWGNASMI